MRDTTKYMLQTIYYVILFFILREWLIPIIELTSTGYLSIFLLFIVICFVFNVLPLPFYIGMVVKLLYIFWFNTTVYGKVSLFSGEAIAFLMQDIGQNLNALTTMQVNEITNPLRTFLFFVLIWMLAYLIKYWLTVKRSVFYFVALTVFFIATIDTFTEYDGSRGIVVTLLLGLVLTAMLYVQKLSSETQTKLNIGSYLRYVVPMVFLISVIGVAAFFVPKADPQWPDPVPFIKSIAGGPDESKQKVGIDEDDSQLGGSFVGDDTVVYEIIADKPQYWKVEHKTIYDSKGWVNLGGSELEIEQDNLLNDLPIGPIENDSVAKIESKSDNTFVIQPYTTNGMSGLDENMSLRLNNMTHRLNTHIGEEKVAMESYVIGFSEPEYSYTILKTPEAQYEVQDFAVDSNYFQIPDTLPQRVRDLAYEITAEYESVYEKAKAVERYFKSSGFRYETEDVAVPAEGQDYVDQFLFDTKIGYCDNFSTSMVMLMRSIDIPARWVKGYAEGKDVGNTPDGQNIYEITNNDAHSWVEVFIPEVGWMPFEPTIGFSANHDIDFDMDLELDTPESDEGIKEREQIERERKEAEDIKTQVTKQQERSLLPIALGVLAVLSLGVLLFLTRRRWTHLLPNAKPTTVKGAYKSLEKRLAKFGLMRKRGETLRAFAVRVDHKLETNEMTKFIAIYERSLYSAESTSDFLEIKESYEYLINRLDG